jgi:hypothetical protein
MDCPRAHRDPRGAAAASRCRDGHAMTGACTIAMQKQHAESVGTGIRGCANEPRDGIGGALIWL